MKKIIHLTLFLPLFVAAQEDQGISFEKGLTWKQLKEKAKTEKKYIFLDCYATWCGPCKVMDKEVYVNEKVGIFVNTRFLSAKVQMDSLASDVSSIKDWYSDAAKIKIQCSVHAYPTYLFFNPDGKLVHRASGVFKADDFVSLASNALDPNKQYYTQLSKYLKGKSNSNDMKQLALITKYTGDEKLYIEIAEKYIHSLSNQELVSESAITFINQISNKDTSLRRKLTQKYLNNLSKEEMSSKENIRFILYAAKNEKLADVAIDLYFEALSKEQILTKENIGFLKQVTRKSTLKPFDFFYNNQKAIDSIMNKENYVLSLIDYIIAKEEVDPFIREPVNEVTEPDWHEIANVIEKKYGKEYAIRIVAGGRARWCALKSNWKEYTQYETQWIELSKGDYMNTYNLNNNSWNVFQYSNNPKELGVCIYWIEKSFDAININANPDTNLMDTYANLLYKVGRIDEAIRWEEDALRISPHDDDIKEALSKMKGGLPTWPVNK